MSDFITKISGFQQSARQIINTGEICIGTVAISSEKTIFECSSDMPVECSSDQPESDKTRYFSAGTQPKVTISTVPEWEHCLSLRSEL